jgi:hypothetical protein
MIIICILYLKKKEEEEEAINKEIASLYFKIIASKNAFLIKMICLFCRLLNKFVIE